MNEDKIWQNIARKFAGEPVNDNLIENWVKEKKVNKTVLDVLTSVWGHLPMHQTEEFPSIYSRLKKRKSDYKYNQNTSSRFIYYTLRVAAILFFLVGTAIIFYNLGGTREDSEMVYQEVYVPKGSRSSFLLPDSSKVWLANNSKIKYPSAFDKNQREIELTGEAYFEVTHNARRPFIVNVGENRIRVLGTKFSVTAYPEDNTVRAELISGKIMFDVASGRGSRSLKSYEVKPSHGIIYEKESGKVLNISISEDFYNYWQNGVYKFNNETLISLVKKIDRIYNARIVIEDEYLKTKRFSGDISINDNIFTFLEAIKRTSLEPIEYAYDERNIYIKLKK